MRKNKWRKIKEIVATISGIFVGANALIQIYQRLDVQNYVRYVISLVNELGNSLIQIGHRVGVHDSLGRLVSLMDELLKGIS